jgi:protocatechuate 3,4-dioxygenase beta subunit
MLRTIKPVAYGLPDDKRPSHIHVKASSGQSPVLTTQLYFQGDPWNRRDPAVRPSLIMTPKEGSAGLTARFDIVIKSG